MARPFEQDLALMAAKAFRRAMGNRRLLPPAKGGNRNSLYTRTSVRFYNDFITILLGFKASEGLLGGPGRA